MNRMTAVGLVALTLSGVCTSAAAASPSAHADTPPPGIVAHVLGRLNAIDDDPEDPTNRPEVFLTVPQGVIRPVRINDDDRTDWLIIWPESTAFCGTGGCLKTLYVSGDDGFSRALERQTLDDLSITRVAGELRIEAGVHHLNCIDDRMDCRVAWTWDEAARRLVPRTASDGVVLLAGAGAMTVETWADADQRPQDSWPTVLRTAWQDSRVVCLTDGGEGYEIRRADIATTPDLDGGGRPDWILTPPVGCDYASTISAFQVWVSAELGQDAEPRLAYTAGRDEGLRTRLDGDGAVLMVTSACDPETECAWVSLRWNAGEGVLQKSPSD